jgi:hypothetical protein
MKRFCNTRVGKVFFILGIIMLGSCTSVENLESVEKSKQENGSKFGVLLMAHGGGQEWNAAVEKSTAGLVTKFPVEVAFGMADAESIEESVKRLQANGVEHIGVVRMFVSGESWYQRTRQILGLEEGAPSREEAKRENPRASTFMPMGFWELDTDLSFYVSEDGLADASEMDGVLISRIQSLSTDPSNEVVVVLAHGTGSDDEDSRWVEKITERTELAKASLGLHEIKVFTLREDWLGKREEAEQRIRSYIDGINHAGLVPLVVPFRVQGFGPYARVLEGLDYKSDGQGLLPHENVSQWIENQTEILKRVAEQNY